MRKKISRKTKLKEHRGEGTGADYKPWIKAREINSTGTTHNIVDWKHGRTIELLSEGETWLYYILRWDDRNIDIREQFPLNLEETNAIAEAANLMKVNHGEDNMTTDMLVTKDDHTYKAYSVKVSRNELSQPRNIEKLWIEKTYWMSHKIPWVQVYKTDLSRTYADNIRLCVEYYSQSRVHDEISMLKHLIATKQIIVDMKQEPLNFTSLAKQYRKELTWKT